LTHIELVCRKAPFASVTDVDSGQVRRVSIEVADRLEAAGRIASSNAEESEARDRVEALLRRSRTLEPGPVRDDVYSQIRGIKRAFPHAFRDGAAYQTQVGWILHVEGGAEAFAPVYLDWDDRAGILAALDALSKRSFEIVHVSEERLIIEADDP
jgi:hypothetical protein